MWSVDIQMLFVYHCLFTDMSADYQQVLRLQLNMGWLSTDQISAFDFINLPLKWILPTLIEWINEKSLLCCQFKVVVMLFFIVCVQIFYKISKTIYTSMLSMVNRCIWIRVCEHSVILHFLCFNFYVEVFDKSNPLHPKVSIHILCTVLSAFFKVLTREICVTFKSIFSRWSFLLFS